MKFCFAPAEVKPSRVRVTRPLLIGQRPVHSVLIVFGAASTELVGLHHGQRTVSSLGRMAGGEIRIPARDIEAMARARRFLKKEKAEVAT